MLRITNNTLHDRNQCNTKMRFPYILEEEENIKTHNSNKQLKTYVKKDQTIHAMPTLLYNLEAGFKI